MNDDLNKIKTFKDLKNIFVNLFPIFFRRKNKIGLISLCCYRYEKIYQKEKFDRYLYVRKKYYPIKFLLGKGIKINGRKYSYFFNISKISIDASDLKQCPPQNLCVVRFINENRVLKFPVVYNAIYYNKYIGVTGPIYKYPNSDLVCYFRQTRMNSIAVTVRNRNVTDSMSMSIKIFFAKILSFLTLKKDIILLYEKESNKYEESARTVYERLIDLGYKNVYFVIRKTSNHIGFIDNKYKNNIIYSFTFKHFYYFFKCHKFIGTETVPHSIELRTKNSLLMRKMIKKNYRMVFLQHGVMYMIALNPSSRGAFLKGGNEMPLDAKVVVSSKLEREHFIKLGGFSKSDLYISGLPFYDRTIKKPDADKIVIMLTVRIWEMNLLESNYKESKYYQMICSILDNIPDEYKNKVYVLPHPLLLDKFKKSDISVPEIISYDKILEDTALLITDYSSIAYSAFYRGANVIFCWEELKECMKHYKSHLMLNSKNVFGDVSRNYSDLPKLIEKNYMVKQSLKNKKRYEKIVEFHDNKNTDRLIKMLKKDKFI